MFTPESGFTLQNSSEEVKGLSLPDNFAEVDKKEVFDMLKEENSLKKEHRFENHLQWQPLHKVPFDVL
jgi:hypothetical protein